MKIEGKTIPYGVMRPNGLRMNQHLIVVVLCVVLHGVVSGFRSLENGF